jgi:hypothetical protein
MAYNKFEQTYVDAYLNNMYPDVEEEQPQDTMLAAAPTAEPAGQVTVSGFQPQQVRTDVQPELGVARPIPQNKAQEALGYLGELLTKAGVQLDKVGVDIPVLGRVSLKDLTVGESGKVLEDMALGFYPVEGAGGFISGTTRIKPDPALELLNIAPAAVALTKLGGKAAIKGVTKAVEATKNMPVGMSTQAVGQGMDELGFYSAAKQAVDAIQQPKGTGAQFLAQISKTPGVKPDEIKWTGLDEFLQSKKSVTKAEVQEYLDKNRVQIKEITLKSKNPYPYQNANDWENAIRREERFGNFDEAERINAAWEDFELGSVDSTKFSKYTLPGGENYREILLTLPPKQKGQSQIAFKTTEDADNFLTDMSISGFEDMNYGRLNDTDVVEFDGAIPSNVMQMIRNNDGDIVSGKEMAGSTYGSPHFEQPNILAHMRVNDRVIDGKKTLFVEEVQSDWHQAGRAKGYQGTAEKDYDNYIKDLTNRYQDEILKYSIEQGMAEDKAKVLVKKLTDQKAQDPRALADYFGESEKQMAMNKARVDERSLVPNAPFKTTWSDLSMKRVIQMASEGGYDRIAFTTGKTQAERYDLSKQIDELLVTKNPNGTFNLEATMPNGGGTRTVGEDITADKLDDIVGKDLANSIRKQESKGDVYSADDLRVGGEGMKGFYDDILPKFLNKYSKKWDAKAGMTEVPTTNAETFAEYLNRKGITESKYNASDSGTRQKMKQDFEKNAKKSGVPAHYIDITPKMRESVVTKGQPMFAIGAGGAGAAATQEENK